MDVYADGMIIKSIQDMEHSGDLRGTFEILQRYDMRLNPKKCIFGVQSGKFLGFMISSQGLDGNPDKVKAFLDVRSPQNVKEVQRLIMCIAALGCFMSKSTNKCQPSFHVLRKHAYFVWDEEVNEDFRSLKSYLARLPKILTRYKGRRSSYTWWSLNRH